MNWFFFSHNSKLNIFLSEKLRNTKNSLKDTNRIKNTIGILAINLKKHDAKVLTRWDFWQLLNKRHVSFIRHLRVVLNIQKKQKHAC